MDFLLSSLLGSFNFNVCLLYKYMRTIKERYILVVSEEYIWVKFRSPRGLDVNSSLVTHLKHKMVFSGSPLSKGNLSQGLSGFLKSQTVLKDRQTGASACVCARARTPYFPLHAYL